MTQKQYTRSKPSRAPRLAGSTVFSARSSVRASSGSPRARAIRFVWSTIFYLAGLGDRVLCLDIDEAMCDQTNRVARARGLPLEARTENLAAVDPDPRALGAEDGFDRVYCFCVIEHVVPPGQLRLARALGSLVRPGGQLCLTFDYGEQAPTEAPIRRPDDVEEIREAIGLPLAGNGSFVDTGRRYALHKHHPDKRYTFGSLFFHRPVAQP